MWLLGRYVVVRQRGPRGMWLLGRYVFVRQRHLSD